ncbi:hypothetical protein M408DRAFT_172795 [Serendipita vermifera MAFF 305830]|uniref:Uncharacterized protein n=1 Tax=Serendipita vermifera MAFF 305830 TaxID=933852 RepID=A0A0C3AR56_SERVB|nr:hypothetical protein M408DRAFT_172795 [Serendipita vermifera MAFF 305830]
MLPASRDTSPQEQISSHLARKRLPPSEYVSTREIDVQTLLASQLPTTPFKFLSEEDEDQKFLEHVRTKNGEAVFMRRCYLQASCQASAQPDERSKFA